THALPSGDDGRHQVDRNLDLVRALGFPVHDDALELRVPDGARCGEQALLAAHGLAPHQPFVLLNPWTSTAARTYDAGRMARAAKLISAAAHLPIVVTAHTRDSARTAALVECIGPAAMNLCGETSVSELAALVARARLVLVNNTSVMHMADALGTPAVILFSGTDLESQWAPRRIPHRLLRRPTRCTPCYAFDCPLDHRCLDIEPAEVADAALALLSATERHA
ncbi:MAG TPA: glycosyltransferase family 9 protein, partial [Gammaproteobacteria bacterium]|nr:glycosyltransferase family 9 protein [Gammaproteobacteria bacterium]